MLGAPPPLGHGELAAGLRPGRRRRYSGPVTSPQNPRPTQPVEYKGEPLDAARGPGLGCFWLQMVVLLVLVVLTPLSVQWGWPPVVSTILLAVVIVLLLFTGQTMIFLLRIVTAGRSEGRRRPLASASRTVGELEDDADAGPAAEAGASTEPAAAADAPQADAGAPEDGPPGVRQ